MYLMIQAAIFMREMKVLKKWWSILGISKNIWIGSNRRKQQIASIHVLRDSDLLFPWASCQILSTASAERPAYAQKAFWTLSLRARFWVGASAGLGVPSDVFSLVLTLNSHQCVLPMRHDHRICDQHIFYCTLCHCYCDPQCTNEFFSR